jgi:hypothetical protein
MSIERSTAAETYFAISGHIDISTNIHRYSHHRLLLGPVCVPQQSMHGTPDRGQRVCTANRLHDIKLMSKLFDKFARCAIHSCSSLSYDRSEAYSKASSPQSGVSSFKWEYPLLSLRSSSSFLRILPRLPLTSNPPFYLSFNNPLQKAVSTQNVTNPGSLSLTYFMQDILLLLVSK